MSEFAEPDANIDEIKASTSPEIIGFYRESQKVRIYGDKKYYYYENGYYGTKEEDYLELDPEEALLLIERGKLRAYELTIQNTEINFQLEFSEEQLSQMMLLTADLFIKLINKINIHFWGRYLVYRDLRSRGYVVRPGYGINAPYRRYPRGTKAIKVQSNVLVYPFVEGTEFELFELEQLVQQSQANRKILILGIVDRSGDVTYYKASEFQLPQNIEQYEWVDDFNRSPENKKNLPDVEIEIENELDTSY